MHLLIPLVLASQVVLGNPGITALNNGAKAIDRNDIARGLELTQQAIDSEHLMAFQIAKARNNLCVGYYKLKLYEEALKHCEEAVSISKHNWKFYNNRANAHLALGASEQALADYRKALDLAPGNKKLKENIRMAVRSLGDEQEPEKRPDA